MLDRLQLQDPRIRRNVIRGIVLAGVLLLAVSLWVWWRFVFTSPRRVFEGMLETSLKTGSFTKRIEQDNQGQKLDQTVSVQTAGQAAAHSMTTLSRSGQQAATVKTESIGTATSDYVRYTVIDTGEKGASGRVLDFSSVLNVWGKNTVTNDNSTGQLYGDTLLGIVPIANLGTAQKAQLLNLIRDKRVYESNYDAVERKTMNGRRVFVYKVEVKTEHYIETLKKFAGIIGLKHLKNLDPANYRDYPPIELEISVDVLSRQLRTVKYGDSGRQETYGSYGALSEIRLPAKTITVEELQRRLQKIR